MDNQNLKVNKEKEAYKKCNAHFNGQSKYESYIEICLMKHLKSF